MMGYIDDGMLSFKEVNQKIIQVILDEGFVLAERDDSVYQFLRD